MVIENRDGSISEFNEAVSKAIRIGELQRGINNFKRNPLAYNEEFLAYNYILWVRDVCSLYGEARDKCAKAEIEKGDAFRKLLLDLIEDKSPFITNRSQVSKKEIITIDNAFWKLLRDLVLEFEDLAKTLLERHGYGAPNKQYAGTAITRF